jgi:hypothetical protein
LDDFKKQGLRQAGEGKRVCERLTQRLPPYRLRQLGDIRRNPPRLKPPHNASVRILVPLLLAKILATDCPPPQSVHAAFICNAPPF